MSRPLLGEAIIAKDDLFVTGFFAAAVAALAPRNLKAALGSWRAGLALGMTLACKYTVLLACPLFVFVVDGPFRAGWKSRQWIIAIVTCLVLFAPWYVRNLVLTGNPLFPVDVKPFGIPLFHGLFGTERDQQLRTAGGIWRMLAQTYHSLPAVLVAILGVGWVASLIAAGRAALRDPLARACTIGSIATVVLFIVTSPHHEVRYMFPIFVLWFGATGLAIARLARPTSIQIGLGALVAIASVGTGFEVELARRVIGLLMPALVITGLFTAGAIAWPRTVRRPDGPKVIAFSAGVAGLALCAFTYVFWHAYLEQLYEKDPNRHGHAGIPFAWRGTYPQEAPLWTYVREYLPDDARIAVANTYYVYPFLDDAYQRRVGYAPTLRGLHEFLHLPRLGDAVPGDLIVQRMTQVMNAEPDKPTWLENLRAMGAQYLVIAKIPEESIPPEARFVREDAGRFEKLFDDPDAGAVYRIIDLANHPSTSPASVRQ
jgi:hypothetical protein